MKVLITGLGLVGKSTFRRILTEKLFQTGKKIRGIDGDYEQLPQKFESDILYIIEDVHGLTKEACLSLNSYDLIIYLLPTFCSHLVFWLKRMLVWFQGGKGSWDKHRRTWLGSGKPYDPVNIPLFICLMLRDLWKRPKWIRDDRKVLSQYKVIFIRPQWTSKGIKFCLYHQF